MITTLALAFALASQPQPQTQQVQYDAIAHFNYDVPENALVEWETEPPTKYEVLKLADGSTRYQFLPPRHQSGVTFVVEIIEFEIDWEARTHNISRRKETAATFTFVGEPRPDEPDVEPLPKPSNLFNLGGKLQQSMKGRPPEEILTMAEVATQFAQAVRFDGEQAKPLIANTRDLGETFAKLTQYASQGRAYATNEFKDLVSDAVLRHVDTGEDALPVDNELREKAAQLFDAVAYLLSVTEPE